MTRPRHGSLSSIVGLYSLKASKIHLLNSSKELGKDFYRLHVDQDILLQYVDLLIARPDYEHRLENAISVFNHLGWYGYKVSTRKLKFVNSKSPIWISC